MALPRIRKTMVFMAISFPLPFIVYSLQLPEPRHRDDESSELDAHRANSAAWITDAIESRPPLSTRHSANEKICFQSFFMLITVQPFFFASSYRACVKVPTLVFGSPCAGP